MFLQVKATVELPARRDSGPFFFSIDHCFPIKGQGTVVTGTVLSGTVKVRGAPPYARADLHIKEARVSHSVFV